MRLHKAFLLSTLLLSAGATIARADEPSIKASLERDLLQPLTQRDEQRSYFSRARLPPSERRVRVINTDRRDEHGQDFATFAIDTRYGSGPWSEGAMVGCIYPADGAIYVKVGETYRPAAMLLGKKAPNPPDAICRSAVGSS